MLLITIVVSSSMAQTSQEYTVDEVAGFQTDLAAGTYDVYILTTPGGVYDLTSLVTITSDVVIKAAEDLAEKPVIMRTNSTGVGAGVLRTQTNTVNIGLEGLIFDGTVTGDDKVVAFRAESTAHFSVNDCVFRNFTDANGVFRLQGAESSIDVRNSVFHDNSQRMIHPWEVNVSYGHINIDNCLFYDIDGPVVWFRSTGGGANLAQGTTLTVNHSTFHNINTNFDGVFRGRENNTGETLILNSVFTEIADTRPITRGFNNTLVDYSYYGDNAPQEEDNATVTNIFTTTPEYVDADALNFEITEPDDFIAGSGDVAGGVWYYPPRILPDLLSEGLEQVRVVFSRPVDQATAEDATNYELSGSFGLTGNPTDATLDNNNEVLLSVGDLTAMDMGETIIVTVTGVEDTYGIVIADNNVATFTKSGYPVTFTVKADHDGTTQPIEGAEITITGVAGSLITDEDGVAVIVLENGTYTYSVDAVDYFPLEDLTFEVDDDALDVPVTMLPIPEPTLTMAPQEVTNRPGQTVAGSSDKTGFIVIVHEDAPQSTLAEIMAAIDADMAASADVETPSEDVDISTEGLEPGVYNGYAVDQNDVISDPIMAVVTVIDFQSSEYTVDEIARLQTDLAAGTYEEYILTTSGGVYDLTTYLNLNGSRTIRGAEGLAEKPVISRTNNTNTFAAIILVTGDNATITLENLIFDGTVTSDDPAHTIAGIRANSTVHVDVDNCVFRNIANINGAFRLQGAGTTVDVRNSVFHDILDRIIHLFSPNEVYGHVNIDNCVFYNLSGSVVYSRITGGESAIQSSLTVNHSTFHNITPGGDGVFRGRDNVVGETHILNSVFTGIDAALTNGISNVTLDYSYVATLNPVPEGNNLFTTAPVYEDADNFNFKITNEDDFIVGGGDVAGVVWYYPPRVHPDLLVENDNQVKLTFSRPVVEATAEIATHYALSGTFGLTGNPTAATMISDREVLLSVDEDVSEVPEDETIIVTVTGVEDTFGMEIGPNNVATYTSTIIIIPEEYLVTFTVTFDDDGTPTPIEGAEITITDVEGTLTTDAGGLATIELENGTYTYSVATTGYVSVVDATFVVEDSPVDVDVTLELIPIPDEPTLTMEPQDVSNREGQVVTGSSDKVGFIAIVRQDAPQADLAEILAAIETDQGASAVAPVAGETVSISTAGLQPGIYNGYAVDEDDVISEPVMGVVTVNDPHSREYPVEQIAQLQTDLATGAYDVYILSTSGGVYDLTSQVTITSDAVIKAAEGLAEKPVIQRSGNTSGSQGIFRIQVNTVNIVLEGLILDGTFSEPGTASPMGFRAESTTHFTVNDCVFRNFDNSNGVFRLDVGGSSIDVKNSVFHDCKERVIHLYTPDEVYGDVNIDNSLFYNINGTVVFYRSSSGVTAIGTNLRVNHSTFHDIKIANPNDGVIRGRDNNTGETLILNSVFTEIEDNWPIIRGFVNNPVVDYCYFGTNSPHTGGGPIVTNTFTTPPVYEDAENAIFRITNADDFLVASGDIAGVVWYYPPRVNPDLLIENDTHLKVVFNRPVEVTSAENTANFELSGTFGLTGNPTSAQLVNEREVLLAVSDISSITEGQTIIVTITGVADNYGMVVDDNNVATYEGTTPVALEVFMESQTVSNAEGQFVPVQSSFSDGFVYIVLEGEPQETKEQLDAAVTAGKGAFAEVTAAMTDTEISTFNLQAGTYFAYAVSMDGDLSDTSTNSIEVTDYDTSTEDILADQIKIFSSNYTIYMKAPLSLHGVGFEVFDISGRKIHAGELDGDNQIETGISGIYIVRVLSDLQRPVKIVVGW